MGSPTAPPKPMRPPPPADLAKAQLNALAYAETERELRKSSGRRGSFITQAPNKPLLGL